MSKKFSFIFSLLVFAILFSFIGCTDLLAPKAQTDINLNIDLSKIIKSARSSGDSQSSISLGENPVIKVAIYDAKNFDATSNSTENLTLITQAQASVGGDGIARVKLSDIPVGIDAIVFAELSFSNENSTQVVYAGNSGVFKVKASDNKVSLVLKKVTNSETSPDNTNTPYENYTLYKKTENGEEEEVSNNTEASISTSSTMETKVIVTNLDSSESVWTYFVKPENKSKFIENGNYKVSVELKADKTTVVGIAAARADYFFTVNDTWTICKFETGYVKGSTEHDFTIGLGLSSEIQIKNLKIEKLSEIDTTEPSLVFDISKNSIKTYLEKTDKATKIIDVSKLEGNAGYNITINTPLSHKESTSTANVQDVKLHLRSYATETTGANRVSFRVDNLGANTFYTSVMADTASEKSTAWNNGTNQITLEKFGSYEIDFPNYVANDELNVDVITSSKEAITEPIQLHISEFAVGEPDAPFANKFFAIQDGENWTKIDDGAPISKEFTFRATESIYFDVVLFNNTAWDETNSTINEDDAWKEATRFFYKGNINTGNFTYAEGYDDSGNPKFKITNNSGSDKIVKISLNENYEVVIEEVTGATITSWDNLKFQIEGLTNSNTTPEFVIANNLTATETITVSNPVKIISDKNVTISRENNSDGGNFEDSFFRVESAGNLELAGTEENQITLDGGNQSSTNYGGAVYVSGGTFTMNDGVTITNCIAQDGGGVYITNGGSFQMTGGTIQNCVASLSGGGVWMNSGSSFTMSGNSKIEECTATQTEGGGVYVTDENNPCTFKMLDNATITGCSAGKDGGGVSYGCGAFEEYNFTMEGDASITSCSATNYGGGVYLYGNLVMNGGKISGCAATRGAGVYVRNDSSLSVSGNAIVNSNFVYLTSGTTVKVAGELTNTIVATIMLDSYTVGTQVLTAESGETLAKQVGKFSLADTSGEYTIGEDGKIAKVSNVIELTQRLLDTKIDSSKYRYTLTAGEYCVTEDIELSYPLQIDGSNGEVKIYSNENKTITCSSNFNYTSSGSYNAMIALPMSSGSLTLGGGTGNLTIDGSDYQNLSYLVFSSSSLTLENNCTITNGTVSDGAVYIGAGSFTMNGGTITNNNSTKCSGIYTTGNPATPTTIRINNGTISNNWVNNENKGASIYCYITNATVNLPDNLTVISNEMFTKNIINGVIQEVATGGGGNESLIQGAYYVSANGDDSNNNGSTYDKPFKTLNKAITSANNSGSKTVYVIGTLNATSESSSDNETVFYIAASVGTADSPINIIGYPDSDATLSALDDTGVANKRVFETNSDSYIKMKDLILTGGNTSKSGAAIYYYNGELTLEDCKINGNETTYSANSDSGIYYDGIYMYGSSNKLNMKNTTCSDGIYLYNSTATIGDGCSLGYDQNESPIIHIDNSQLTLSGSVQLNNPIYSDAKSPISVGSTLTTHNSNNKITIKLSEYSISTQILSVEDVLNLVDEVQKFSLADSAHSITDQGYIE